MEKLSENLPAIIGAAAQSNLGILALFSVALSILAYLFFSGASDKIKVGIFVLLFFGVASFGIAMFSATSAPSSAIATAQTPPNQETDVPIAKERKPSPSSKPFASFELIATRKYDKRVEKPFTRDLGQFKATNSRQYKDATPENGWMWDINKQLQVIQGHGEAGRCEGVDMNKTSEKSVSVFAHLDKIQNLTYPLGTDGFVNCSLRGTIFRNEPQTEDVSPQKGTISWDQDKAIPLPDNVESYTLTVTTYDGRVRIFTSPGTDKLYEVQRTPTKIIVRPKLGTSSQSTEQMPNNAFNTDSQKWCFAPFFLAG